MNRKLKLQELGRVSVDEYKSVEKLPLVVVLDNIRSHHNVGSVFRTSDAFLVEKIVLAGYTPHPPHREIQKTALGATDSVKWEISTDTLSAVAKLKSEGYEVYAIEQTENSVLLQDFNPEHRKIAFVFGNEVGGVDQEVIDICHGVVEVPMRGVKHSLNISVCAGIILWELYRKLNLN